MSTSVIQCHFQCSVKYVHYLNLEFSERQSVDSSFTGITSHSSHSESCRPKVYNQDTVDRQSLTRSVWVITQFLE